MSARPLVVAAGLLALAVITLGHVSGSMATFTDSATVTAGTSASPNTAFSTGSIATPAAPGTAQTAPTSVTLTWSATAVGANGGVASAYDVLRFPSASGGTPTTVCSVTALTCVDTTAPSGTSYYVLRARFAANWVKDSARIAFTPDTTAPTLTISTPLNGCAGTVVACGTATDPGAGSSGVAKVEYTLRRTRVFIIGGTSYSCWNGSTWVAANADNSCTFSPATGTTAWSVPGAKATAYADSLIYTETYTLSARATDAVGNVGTTVTATYAP